MARRTYTLLLTVTSIILFVVLILTPTHGSFDCEVDTADGVQTCTTYGITEDEEDFCKGSAYIIHADIDADDEIKVVCPWSTATIVILMFGALVALVYTISTIMQRSQKRILTGKALLIVGLASLGVLLLADILMLNDIVGGISKCGMFEKDIEYMAGADCSTAVFDITLMFAVISFGLVAYEIFLGYSKYKSEEDGFETEGVYVPAADYTKSGLFQEYEYETAD